MKDYPSHLVEEIIGWHKFRQLLSSLFPKRKNAIIDLIDSNSCNDSSSSPVELSESDLFPLSDYQNLVIISRVRSSRVFDRWINQNNMPKKKSGHPTWYGQKFDLKDPETWWDEDETFSGSTTNKKGSNITINIKCWNDLR